MHLRCCLATSDTATTLRSRDRYPFLTQLNMYSFHKVRENNAESYFHHDCFDQHRPHRLADIRRKPERKKKRAEEESEGEGQT